MGNIWILSGPEDQLGSWIYQHTDNNNNALAGENVLKIKIKYQEEANFLMCVQHCPGKKGSEAWGPTMFSTAN